MRKMVRLGDVCQKITDGTHHSPVNGPEGAYKYVTAKNIKPWGLDLSDITYVDEETHREIYSRCDVKPNDVLLIKDGATTGRVAVNTLREPFSLLSSVGVLRPGSTIESKYLAYALQSPAVQDLMLSKVSGVAITRLTLKKIKELEIPIVPLDEQRQIVAEIEKQFSRLDEAVANLQRVKANLKRYKASVLKAAVEGRLVETEASIAQREGRSYETGEQLLRRILEERRAKWSGKGRYKEPLAPVTDDLSVLPEGWTWARLDSLAALKGGITVDSKRVDPSSRSVPYLRVANVQRGFIDLTEVKQINASPADIEELCLKHGDVLFNEGGDRDKLGRGWIWEGQLDDCIHQNHVFRARMYLGGMSPKLVSWWGNTFGKDYFLRVGKQTTNLASISLGKLSEFPVPVPPPVEQLRMVQEIERLLSVFDEVETDVDSNLQRAKVLRGAVLSKAFSRS